MTDSEVQSLAELEARFVEARSVQWLEGLSIVQRYALLARLELDLLFDRLEMREGDRVVVREDVGLELPNYFIGTILERAACCAVVVDRAGRHQQVMNGDLFPILRRDERACDESNS